MTEMVGYDGPIYMTHPTKAICPILLVRVLWIQGVQLILESGLTIYSYFRVFQEDMRKVMVERKGESNFFSSAQIRDCMKKVIPVNLHQSVMVDDELEIKAYYAGHVLGAAMFSIRVGRESVVYTVWNTFSLKYTLAI